MRAITGSEARKIEYALVTVQIAVGMLHENPAVWYRAFFDATATLIVTALCSAAAFQCVAILLFKMGLAYQIQTSDSAQPTFVLKEIKDTLLGFGCVVGAMAAWPLANSRLGYETALRDNINECVLDIFWLDKGTPAHHRTALAIYITKMFLGLLIADCYNYWKHRWFHHKVLWAFHKVHHSHHNPSALAGYAVSPMFGFCTFLPVYLFVFPELGLYMPVHWPVLLFYFLLNHYLHCGYVVPALEAVMGPCYIMTSAWHNVHHEKGRVGFNYKAQTFGEMFSIWDHLCGTHAQDNYLHAGYGGDKKSSTVDSTKARKTK